MIFRVDVWEHERGWGSRIDFSKDFNSDDFDGNADKALLAANTFVKEFNEVNNLPEVPDWYMTAHAPILIS